MPLLNEKTHRLIYTLRMMSWIIDPRSYLPQTDLKIDRPIFLLGTQGGGLTLLARMLQRHPSVISAAGNSDYWTSANEIQNVYGPILPFELTGLRYKAPDHPVLKAPRSWTFAARDLYAVYRKTALDATLELAKKLKNIIRLSAVRQAHDKNNFRFMDKSQVFSVRAGLINALLKDCDPKFVFVPRDPYISVLRAAEGKAGDMRRLKDVLPYQERIDICAEHYARSMQAVFDDADHDKFAVLTIPFETLLVEPEKSLRRVCDFAGLSFSADMIPRADHKMPIGSRFLDRWYPIRANVNDAYANKIDGLTIERVNHYCGDLIERLGYKRLEVKNERKAS